MGCQARAALRRGKLHPPVDCPARFGSKNKRVAVSLLSTTITFGEKFFCPARFFNPQARARRGRGREILQQAFGGPENLREATERFRPICRASSNADGAGFPCAPSDAAFPSRRGLPG